MPSPTGRNTEQLYINVNPRGAYDEALDPASAADLLEFLRGKLSDQDLATFCRMAGIDAGAAMDSPEPFKGMPTVGGGKFGQDAQRTQLARIRANAAKIKVSR
jgi:hypothetical protein